MTSINHNNNSILSGSDALELGLMGPLTNDSSSSNLNLVDPQQPQHHPHHHPPSNNDSNNNSRLADLANVNQNNSISGGNSSSSSMDVSVVHQPWNLHQIP